MDLREVRKYLLALIVFVIVASVVAFLVFGQAPINLVYGDYISELTFEDDNAKLVLSEAIFDLDMQEDSLMLVFVGREGEEYGAKVPLSTEPFYFQLSDLGIEELSEVNSVEVRFAGSTPTKTVTSESGKKIEVYHQESNSTKLSPGKKKGSGGGGGGGSSGGGDSGGSTCTPSFVNTSWSLWVNQTDCVGGNQTQNRSLVQYDSRGCVGNVTFWESQTIPCVVDTSCKVTNNQSSSACYNGEVYWFDNCGGLKLIKQDCSYGCSAGACLACTPSCSGKECGDNGCGGVCGSCGSGEVCGDGTCQAVVISSNCADANVLCVDDTPGSFQEYATVQAAVNAVLPGQTILIKQGTYRESVTVGKSGTPSQPITIRNYPGDRPTMEGWTETQNWQRCDQVVCEDLLNINGLGVNNTHLNQIYKTEVGFYYSDGFFILDDGEYYGVSRWPEQSDNFFTKWSEFQPVQNTPSNQNTRLVEDEFNSIISNEGVTPVDDFWKNAEAVVWLHNYNSNTNTRTISAYDSDTGTITFSSALLANISYTAGTVPDAYSIKNHPFLLDKPKEYYVSPQKPNGKYYVYMIPVDTNFSSIKIPSLYEAFYLYGNKDNIIIEGLEFRGYSGSTWAGGVVTNGDAQNLTVRNNYFHDMSTDSAALVYGGDHNIVEDNVFERIKTGSAVRFSDSDYVTVRDNYIDNVSSSTFIRFQTVSNGVIFNNTGRGGGDNHAQAISLYIGSEKILVMNNLMYDVAAGPTFNTGSNFSLIGNIFDSAGRNSVAYWSGTYHDCTLFNNIITSRATGVDVGKALAGSYLMHVAIVKNNIIDGYLGDNSNPESVHEYNLYTERAYNQYSYSPYFWQIGTGEQFALNQHANVFQDYVNRDYRLKAGSVAINNGTNIMNDLPIFLEDPFYDQYVYLMDKDFNGNPRDAQWDIGPYEYGSVAASSDAYVLESVEIKEKGFFASFIEFVSAIFTDDEEEISPVEEGQSEETVALVPKKLTPIEKEEETETVKTVVTPNETVEENATEEVVVNETVEENETEEIVVTPNETVEQTETVQEYVIPSDYKASNSGNDFNGSQYSSFAGSGLGITSEFSISLWARFDTVTEAGSHIIRRGAYIYPFMIDFTGGSTDKRWIRAAVRSGGNTNYMTSTSSVKTGELAHLVLTFSNGTAKLYVNGKEDVSKSLPSNLGLGSESESIYVGGLPNDAYPLTGHVEKILVYNRVLEGSEVKGIYCAQGGDCSSNPVTGFFIRWFE
jgi:hypothetical protein